MVSGFFPYGFLARRFLRSTSWESMKAIVFRAFNHQINAASLLQYGDVLKRSADENYYIFYERMLDYFVQHLAGPNITAGGFNNGAHGDDMTLSENNGHGDSVGQAGG